MRPDVERLIGESPAFLRTLEQVSLVAPLEKPVLVVGERGTGKELIASRLHFLSNRWEGQFIKMNCAAISESLLESELFGHEAGAFTGATKAHRGRFERAHGGTLFLDELDQQNYKKVQPSSCFVPLQLEKASHDSSLQGFALVFLRKFYLV